jgi:hypothetical protein
VIVMGRYKTKYVYWPIRLGWVRNSSHKFITWHGWGLGNSPCHPDASPKISGWTIHIGNLKIYFGLKNKGNK